MSGNYEYSLLTMHMSIMSSLTKATLFSSTTVTEHRITIHSIAFNFLLAAACFNLILAHGMLTNK